VPALQKELDMRSTCATVAGIMGVLAVALGAFGAHALAPKLGERGRELWALASQYTLLHAVALLALSAVHPRVQGVTPAAAALAVGTVLFSGSLFGLALGGPRWLGPVTPLGGLLLLLGWGAVASLGWRLRG
jgi:uncharacterized membrane protein YgdD (TMEM256/DUF423 family)